MAIFELTKDHGKALIFKDIEEISKFALGKWKEISESAVRRSGRFTVALSGGKTPIPFYNSLASYGKAFPWDKTHIFLVDERFVPDSDPDSNFGMIKNCVLNKIPVPETSIHPHANWFISRSGFPIGAGAAEIAAEKYEEDIRSFFTLKEGQLPQFDLIILGVGKDGHTASLFPDDKVLSENRRLVCAVSSSAVNSERVTLTFPAINNAKTVIFLVTGGTKAGIMKEIMEKENAHLPAFLVKPDNGELYYLIDKDAASEIDYDRGKG